MTPWWPYWKKIIMKNMNLKEAHMLNTSLQFHPNQPTGYREEDHSNFGYFSNSGHIGRAPEKKNIFNVYCVQRFPRNPIVIVAKV